MGKKWRFTVCLIHIRINRWRYHKRGTHWSYLLCVTCVSDMKTYVNRQQIQLFPISFAEFADSLPPIQVKIDLGGVSTSLKYLPFLSLALGILFFT